ncbi:hypothetical protein FKG96_12585 [Olivibacter sp. LS-1]|uniref:hypothetical protein n=1 Tax=Olivibacter sp. LS-1 TaxID=2592345 RepID=UPI0011EB86FF|nr:hypothetical protein [Olivibacter sp. LS-1]QEL01609.1 hypothetical protein FKG96_12585 [Olivibacter sp. LS-1]
MTNQQQKAIEDNLLHVARMAKVSTSNLGIDGVRMGMLEVIRNPEKYCLSFDKKQVKSSKEIAIELLEGIDKFTVIPLSDCDRMKYYISTYFKGEFSTSIVTKKISALTRMSTGEITKAKIAVIYRLR